MMPRLTSEEQELIYNTVRENFSDFPLFDALVSEKLRHFLAESVDLDISVHFTKTIFRRYFSHEAFKSPEKKALVYPLELIFQTASVLITSYRHDVQHLLWNDKDTFLAHYPKFAQGIDEIELKLLMQFRNMLKVALIIIPAPLNKNRLLHIAGSLEGSHNDYVTGSGQRVEVDRRVKIYQQEGQMKMTESKRIRNRYQSNEVMISGYNNDDVKGRYYLSERRKRGTSAAGASSITPKKVKECHKVLTCTPSSFSKLKLQQMVLSDDMVQSLLQDAPSNVVIVAAATTTTTTSTTTSATTSTTTSTAASTSTTTADAATSPLLKPTCKSTRVVNRHHSFSHPVDKEASDIVYNPHSRPLTAPAAPSLTSTASASAATLTGLSAAAAAAAEARGRRRRLSSVEKLEDTLFPAASCALVERASSVSHSGTGQDSSTSFTLDDEQQPSNLHLWHMNMHQALRGWEDLLGLTGQSTIHQLVQDTVNVVAASSDITERTAAAAPREGAVVLPELCSTHKVGINSGESEVLVCGDWDPFTTTESHSGASGRSGIDRSMGTSSEEWEDDSVVLLSDYHDESDDSNDNDDVMLIDE